MRRVVIDMQNVLFADAVAEALRRFDSEFEPIMSEVKINLKYVVKMVAFYKIICYDNYIRKNYRVSGKKGPDDILPLCYSVLANVLIMEVTAYTPWKFEERIKIRDELRKNNPECKIVLVVDENTEKKLADKVRCAKKDGLVDNFIYGSVSSSYLSAVIDAL